MMQMAIDSLCLPDHRPQLPRSCNAVSDPRVVAGKLWCISYSCSSVPEVRTFATASAKLERGHAFPVWTTTAFEHVVFANIRPQCVC